MQSSKNLSVFAKIMSAFLVVVCMTCGLGAFSIYELSRVRDTTNNIKDNWLPSVRTSLSMRRALAGFRVLEIQHLLSQDAATMASYEKRMNDAQVELDGIQAAYVKLISDPEERRLFDEFKPIQARYLALHDQMITASHNGQNEQAVALARGESLKLRVEADAKLAGIVDINQRGADLAGQQAEAIASSARNGILAALALSVVASVLLAFLFARGLVRQLGGEPGYAAEIAKEIADGNLTVEVQLRPGDRGSMLYAMSGMRQMLATIIANIKTSAESVAVASAEIAQGNAHLSQRTEEQASSLEETAASMEQLTVTVKQNADNAHQANRLAAGASDAAGRGRDVIGEVTAKMKDITDSSNRINAIIEVIEGIAFQTNILALNAAVEAARAGEQGRAFAVVAGEVRTLAHRSATAAREIRELIGESVGNVEIGAALVGQASEAMAEIVQSVQRVTAIMENIAVASKEQTSGIEQVNAAVVQIDEVTQQNAALVEEAAAAAGSLDAQSVELRAAVSVFRLRPQSGSAPLLSSNTENVRKLH